MQTWALPLRNLIERAQVIHISSDDPSMILLETLKAQCGNLRVLSLDPMHIVFTYEQAHWRKITPGSQLLRRIMAKLTPRSDAPPGWDMNVFNGVLGTPASVLENRLLDQIGDCSMPQQDSHA